ncbi:hypothetical protein RND81_08G207100 [Saponaria officinalis]|uniref:HMG box domain-containing protein n=1 Tax=Saponaria officinalis TaxID=3572 RepID=A0AAW1JB41_SAPOF
MANQPRSRKRVRALCRAPDGSAFQKCDECGVSVAVALMDMHECNMKMKNVKRLKENINVDNVVKKKVLIEEPRSPFIFFMESYGKICETRDLVEINNEAFQKWKNMSQKEQWPYILQAQKVEKAYVKALHQEINEMSQEEDDEADSATVGKFVQHYEDYDNSDCSHSWDSCDWPAMCSWHCG